MSEKLLLRVCADLCGSRPFVGSLTTWRANAAADVGAFFEQRILLVAARFCSVPARRRVIGTERVDALIARLPVPGDAISISLAEREELLLVSAWQRGGDSLSEGLWARTRQSIRGAIRGRYSMSDDIVDELVADVGLKLHEANRRFDASRMPFHVYARRVAIWVVADHWRRVYRRGKAAHIESIDAWQSEDDVDAWPERVDVPDTRLHAADDNAILQLQEFFYYAFGGDSQFHYKLALGFNVLHEYPASKIVADLSDQPFGRLRQRLVSDYPASGRLNAWIHTTALPLEAHLRRAPELVAATFEAYYTGETLEDKHKNVDHWAGDLKWRTIERMVEMRAAR